MKYVKIMLIVFSWFIVSPLFAANLSPEGYWQTVDDVTQQPVSIVHISFINGELQGVIVRYFPAPGDSATPICKKCPGSYKNQPLMGMKILWGFKAQQQQWMGGRLVAPKRGEIVPCNLKLRDGNTLELHAFPNAFMSKTIPWQRVAEPK